VGQVQPLPLGRAFLRCAARYRESDKRAGRAAVEGVPVPPGAPPMRAFSEARRRAPSAAGGGGAPAPPSAPPPSPPSARGAFVPPALLAWLGEQNGMDAALHAAASRALDAARDGWRRRGRLRELSAEEEARAAAVAAAAGDGPMLKAMMKQGRQQQQQQQEEVV
jgi:hypothetical protein